MLSEKARFFLMRAVTNKTLRDFMINRKVRRIGKQQLRKGESAFIEDKQIQFHISRLSQDGCTALDRKLSSEMVETIIKYSEDIGCFDTYRSDTKRIDPNNAPIETHVASFRREDLIRFEPILEIANDSGILSVVQEFLGATPTISNVNMWWSFGGRKHAEHAQLFHRDVDDWKFCKLFIYLTDVSENSGPHVYVKGTSQSPSLRRIRRYSDAEIEGKFGKENILQFIGKKGSAFLVDTYGFHKGLLPKSDNRLLLQVQYSLSPIGIEDYKPIVLDSNGYDSYINRLLFKLG